LVAVANKVKNAEDEKAIEEFCQQVDLPIEAIIPFDTVLADADKKGAFNLDDIHNSPAIDALRNLANKLAVGEKV
jgi:nitrogenase subunit NifH